MFGWCKSCLKKDLRIEQLELQLKEKDETINNLKTAVQLATSETMEYKKFLVNTLRSNIKVDQKMEDTFDFKPRVIRLVTQTIEIPKLIITAKEAHEIRALIDEITRR